MRHFKGLCVGALLAIATAAGAVLPDEQLADPALESRAREVSKDLRCVVCQNQSIDDSDAPLARDLRIIVREQITAGKSNEEVKAFLVERYGNFVLLRPPLERATILLWLGPLLVLLAGAAGVWAYVRQRRSGGGTEAPPLDPEEQARLDRLIKGDVA